MSRGLKWTIVVSVLLVFWLVTAPFLANRLIVNKQLEKADVIFVLSGSAVYSERTRRAAKIYRDGVSRSVLLSDDGKRAGWSVSEQRNPRFVELATRSLVRQGVPSEAISVLDANVSGTIYEARGFANAAGKNGWRSVLIVTSAYHTRRAIRTFERELEGSDIRIGIASPPPGEQTPHAFTWWLTPRGWRYVAGEYVKSVYYWISF